MKPHSLLKPGAAFLLIALALAADFGPLNGGSPQSSILPPRGKRDQLTADDLLNGRFPRVVHNEYFMPVGESAAPGQTFSGTIIFSETRMNTTRPDSDWSGTGQSYFPAFSLAVVRKGDSLIPLERGIIESGGKGRSFWNVIASPGRVWQETGDGGWCRASFPFVLTESYVGQALNGLATFLFTPSEISWVAVQITQETSPKMDYTRADLSAAVRAQFIPRTFEDSGRIIEAYHKELAARPPVKNWSELPSGGFTRSFFNGDLPDESISISALYLDEVLYVQPAETRSGPYPYPLDMRHGVFSVTKTLATGLSMFYCAERYGEGLFNELITDYVPELAAHPGWQGVTFGNALDMATGTVGYDRDTVFIRARSTADKLTVVRTWPDAPYAPGARFDYGSSNTFTLSCALNRYIKAREGPEADYWLLVRDNVLKPLGIEHLSVMRTVEPDGSTGTPAGGWGCYPTVIEAAKIGLLLSDEGVYEGRRLLNRNKVREALERTSQRGLATGQPSRRYIHSFWIGDISPSTGLVTAPYMAGHGGNFVIVLPGGTIGIRLADEDVHDITPMVAVMEYYRRLRNAP